MNQRFLMWGLASITFVVTAAVSSWNDGLWQSAETLRAPVHPVRTASFTTDDSTDLPARPFAPAHQAPAAPPAATVAAVAPPPPVPTPEEEAAPPAESSAPVSAQELDEADFEAHRDRNR
jgi:type IV secretory pathway VirB10-like protein